MNNHLDPTYLVVETLLASRRREAEEYRLSRKREHLEEETRPTAKALRCRLLALAGGKEPMKVLSLIRADRLFTTCL